MQPAVAALRPRPLGGGPRDGPVLLLIGRSAGCLGDPDRRFEGGRWAPRYHGRGSRRGRCAQGGCFGAVPGPWEQPRRMRQYDGLASSWDGMGYQPDPILQMLA